MSGKRLSQNQVENLVKAMQSPQASQTRSGTQYRIDASHADPPTGDVTREQADDQSPRQASGEVVVDYDFRQPPRLSRDQLQSLHWLHSGLAKSFTHRIAELMRSDVECRLVDVDQCGHQEFVASIEDPSCFCVIDAQPLNGQWALDIPPAIAFALIDRMLGGEPFPGETIRRPMTEIEARLIRRVIDDFVSELQQAWRPLVPLAPVVASVDDHPHCLQDMSVNDQVVRVQLEVSVCSVRGDIWFCIPVRSIEHLTRELSQDNWSDRESQKSSAATQHVISNQIAGAPVDVVVNVARSTIRTRDLLALGVGDIIATETEVSEPLELSIQQVPKFTARAGAYQGKKAVQIESLLEPTTEGTTPREQLHRGALPADLPTDSSGFDPDEDMPSKLDRGDQT
ncbi:MAG: flagellar motor switch protein FliM [Pirellulaceae bacterium]|nr:flagellar motor switch protein FliM [Pirellulaceae bacterium]